MSRLVLGKNNIPENWKSISLVDICNIVYGKNLPTKKMTISGYPVFGANGIIGKYEKYNYEHEQILISCRGANSGVINKSPSKSFITNNSLILEIPNELSIFKNFLYYYLKTIDKSTIVSGTAQPQVTIENLKKVKVTLPPLKEQKRIVSKIEELFSLVDSLKENLEKTKILLKQYRQSILKHAFEGKLVPQDPNDEPASVLLEKIKKENPSQKTSNIVLEKELPRGWSKCKINDITKSRRIGIDRARRQQSDSGIPYLKMNNITIDGSLDLESLVYIQCTKMEEMDYCLEYGDIVFNTRNSYELVGKTAFWNKIIPNCVYNNNIMRLRTYELILPKFLVYFMNSAQFRKSLLSIKRATTNICAIYDKDLREQIIPLPPLNEQKKIVVKIEESFSIIEKNEKLVDSLLLQYSQIKNSILKQAFKGKLVPQDPNDEPAQILLEKIQQERKKNGK